MEVEIFGGMLRRLGIETVTGIPDSTLKVFCDYMNHEGKEAFLHHIVPANEGAAVGIAIGEYLATGRPACVYMQNSGLGNTVNPLTSLAHRDVYGIPMLLVVGWRGEPGTQDEPQHKYMGKVTPAMLETLDIAYSIVARETTQQELEGYLEEARHAFEEKRQYALIVRRGAFLQRRLYSYKNTYALSREEAIGMIAGWLEPDDLVVSTTGKISRELYEQSDAQIGNHRQVFMTVGGMGHANMIAYQLAKRQKGRRVICLDGDGALLMHMGNMAFVGANPEDNFVHICLNNQAHESVGGMPTGAPDISFWALAEKLGYERTVCVSSLKGLERALTDIRRERKLTFLEVLVSLGSREDLGRPVETAQSNKETFMEAIGDKK